MIFEKLTEEQRNRIPEIVEYWKTIAVSTETIVQEAAEKAVEKAYTCAGLTPPKVYVHCASPIDIIDKIKKYVEENEADSDKMTRADIFSKCNFMYGSMDAMWISYYDFFRKCTDIEGIEQIDGLIKVCEECGWVVPLSDAAFISDRPSILKYDEQYRLHNTEGPAIAYRDGFKIYCVHGINVPEWIIETPEKITTKAIDKETNLELRRIMISIYGSAKYILDAGAEKLHEDEFGVLYKKSMKDDVDIVMVKVINSTPEEDGTFHEYFLQVDPQLRPMLEGNQFGDPQEMTARNAVASTFGKRGEEYAPEIES